MYRIDRPSRPLCVALLLLAACGEREPLSYPALVAGRIRSHAPDAVVEVAGHELHVKLAGRSTTVDVRDIELQCHRGPRDCERAIDQVLLALPVPGK